MVGRDPGHAPGTVPSKTFGRFESALVRANQAVVIAMMTAMVALVFTNVVCRYALNFSIIWAEELSQYLMVWITFLGAGLALREGRHVAVEMLQDHLPLPASRFLRALVAASVVVFLLVLTILGVEFSWFARDQQTPVMNISLGLPYLAVPIGALLFAVHLSLVFRGYLDKSLVAAQGADQAAHDDGA